MICKWHKCRKRFRQPAWPSTRRKVYCSRRCLRTAWAAAHPEAGRAWVDANRSRVRKIKRRYNHSEKGRAARRRHYRRNAAAICLKLIGTPEQRAAIAARQRSRRRLLKHRAPVCTKASSRCRPPVDCHHRDENPHNDALANLVWLCRYHHSAEHQRKVRSTSPR